MVALSLIGSLLLALPAQAAPQAWMGVALSGDGDARTSGVGIVEVFEGSPAAAAGLRAGDRLMSMDERPLAGYEDLVRRLSTERPGARRNVWVRRDMEVRLDPARSDDGRPLLGVMLAAGEYEGMLTITEVLEDSPAEHAGLRAGDQLRTVAGEGTPTVARLRQVLAQRDPGGSVLAGISRRLTVELGIKPGAAQQPRIERSRGAEERGRIERRMREIEAARERGRSAGRVERQPDRRWKFEEVPHPAEHPDHGDHADVQAHEHGEVRGQRNWQGDEHDLGQRRQRLPETLHSGESLERELRELSEGLRALRAELSELRRELRARDGRR